MKQYFAKYGRYIDVDVNYGSLGPQRKPPAAGFTLLPGEWERRLVGCREGAVWNVALYLVRQGAMTNWQPVKVTNAVMKKRKITRWPKARALNKLEKLGLIKVWKGGGKRSPVAVFKVRGEVESGA